MSSFLDCETFNAVIKSAPLVSIDLCLVFEDKILLGKRNNEPLKDQWFTPGGRIQKNESWQAALRRIALSELGLCVDNVSTFFSLWVFGIISTKIVISIKRYRLTMSICLILRELSLSQNP